MNRKIMYLVGIFTILLLHSGYSQVTFIPDIQMNHGFFSSSKGVLVVSFKIASLIPSENMEIGQIRPTIHSTSNYLSVGLNYSSLNIGSFYQNDPISQLNNCKFQCGVPFDPLII